MTKYSSQTGLGEPGALSKHLQNVAYATILALTRMLLQILFLAGFFIANPAGAETLTGTVVSVEDKHFIVREKRQEETKTTGQEFRVVFVPARNKPHFLGQPYPYCVRIGKAIRLKGQWDTEKNIFLAREIRRCPNQGKHHRDPTGVRARLGRCRNPQAEP